MADWQNANSITIVFPGVYLHLFANTSFNAFLERRDMSLTSVWTILALKTRQ